MKVKIGFVPLHRVPFDDEWGRELKHKLIEAMSSTGVADLVYPDESLTEKGLVRNDDEAKKVVSLFKEKGVQGIAMGTVTFGEELAGATVAEAFKGYPMAVFGTEEPPQLEGGFRRSDSFCGTLSLSSALTRRKIPFVFFGIVKPDDLSFKEKFEDFARATAVVSRLRNARLGLLGPKPSPFETVTINEAKMAEKFGQRVTNVTLMEVVERAKAIKDDDPRVQDLLKDYQKIFSNFSQAPSEAVKKVAKLEIVMREIRDQGNYDGMAVRCWNEIEQYYGIAPCFAMGRMTGEGVMTACESDIYGTLSMMAQYEASLESTPPHFVDWTIKNPNDPNAFLAWHCGNAPVSLAHEGSPIQFSYQSVLFRTLGKESSYGTAEFRLKPGPVTITRINEYDGEFKMFITRGEIVDEPGEFRGDWSWVRLKDLDAAYRKMVEEGFVHHASIIHGDYVEALREACLFLGIRPVVV